MSQSWWQVKSPWYYATIVSLTFFFAGVDCSHRAGHLQDYAPLSAPPTHTPLELMFMDELALRVIERKD